MTSAFERMSDSARQVVMVGNRHARTLKQTHEGPQHLLLGLLADTEGLPYQLLNKHSREDASSIILKLLPTGDSNGTQATISRGALGVIDEALRQAERLKVHEKRPEHILLALTYADEVEQLIQELGWTQETLRKATLEAIATQG